MNKRVLLLTGLVLALLLSTACTAKPEKKAQATAAPSDTPSPAATSSPTATHTPTLTPLPTDTPTATHTCTPKPTIAPTHTRTATPAITPAHTPTPRPTPAPAVMALAYWPFDGDLKDASGNSYDLQQTAGNLNFVPSCQGQAIHFNDDPASYLTREQDDPIFDFGKRDYSVELWVTFDRITSQSHEQTLIEKCRQEGGCSVDGWSLTVLDYGPDTLRFIQNPGPHGPTDTPTLFTQSGHWYHVVVARQNETVYLYVDGQQVGSGQAYDIQDSDYPLILGRRADETQLLPLIGAFDEVTIYQGALPAAEVQAHYQRAKDCPLAEAAPMPIPTEMPLTYHYLLTDDTWKFTRDPAPDWPQPDYDDSAWAAADAQPCQKFPGEQPAACIWDYPYQYVPDDTLYFRKTFDVAQVPPRARVITLVDDDVDIYLNGALVLHDGDDTNSSGISWWETDVTSLIRPGANVLAFRGVDTGQGIAYVQAALGLCSGAEDQYAPLVQIMNHWEDWFNGDVYLEAVDAPCDSGVVEIAYRLDGGPWQVAGPHARFQLPPGEHDLEARATDGAGRQAFDAWHFRVSQP